MMKMTLPRNPNRTAYFLLIDIYPFGSNFFSLAFLFRHASILPVPAKRVRSSIVI